MVYEIVIQMENAGRYYDTSISYHWFFVVVNIRNEIQWNIYLFICKLFASYYTLKKLTNIIDLKAEF